MANEKGSTYKRSAGEYVAAVLMALSYIMIFAALLTKRDQELKQTIFGIFIILSAGISLLYYFIGKIYKIKAAAAEAARDADLAPPEKEFLYLNIALTMGWGACIAIVGCIIIAIMTALNLADDLIKKDTLVSEITAEKNELSSQLNMHNTIIDSVSDKIENAIEEFEKKESSPK